MSNPDDKNKNRLEKITNFFEEKQLSEKGCVFCGHVGFFIVGYDDAEPVISLKPFGKYYDAYAVSCSNCGFVHTFLAKTVNEGE